ncbi:MAG: molecular chaperone DnaJ [Alphaproteobacteria bacterium]|nr:molecular chaperone DnaJ [Alphaproteobacteria bacterium]
MTTDYYSTLGISKNATTAEIKKAYHKQVKENHPDKNKGDVKSEEKFKKINEAYQTLKDDNKKSAYDRMGHGNYRQQESHGGQSQHGGFHQAGGGQGFEDVFSDIFSQFGFGGNSRNQGSENGDILRRVNISLADAYSGAEIDLNLPTHKKCTGCGGTKDAKRKPPTTCSACGGKGFTVAGNGFFNVKQPCRTCRGQGRTVENPCRKCNATGYESSTSKVSVSIPKGVETGTRLSLSEHGEIGDNGPGTLYLEIQVEPNNIFDRRGDDLFITKKINFIDAILGGYINITHLDGKTFNVKIPERCQVGTKLRIKGKGMPTGRGDNYGNLWMITSIELPSKLSKKQTKILKEFKDAS